LNSDNNDKIESIENESRVDYIYRLTKSKPTIHKSDKYRELNNGKLLKMDEDNLLMLGGDDELCYEDPINPCGEDDEYIEFYFPLTLTSVSRIVYSSGFVNYESYSHSTYQLNQIAVGGYSYINGLFLNSNWIQQNNSNYVRYLFSINHPSGTNCYDQYGDHWFYEPTLSLNSIHLTWGWSCG
jgi:hypothetical protein